MRVADFGIARLKTAQTTRIDPNGSAMGSVHYLSPEQARGEVADEQSDLYSVGIVLYEMLTGNVPFDGDNTISVALKHVSEEPVSVRSRNGEVSRALDEVIMRALCKDKQRRYQSAAEMATDLRKTISHPHGGFVRYPKLRDENDESVHDERKKKHFRSKKKSWKWVLIVCIAAALLAAGLSAAYLRMFRGTIPMPDLIGADQMDAVQIIEEMGIEPIVVNAYSEEIPNGSVMLQSRVPGDMLRKNAQITLTVSLGSQWYVLPNMVGMNSEEAIDYLANAGVSTVNVSYMQSDLPTGTIIYQEPHSGHISRDVPILIKISGQSVAVSSLSGLTLDGARAVIEAEGLVLGTVSEGESADAKSGTVIAQSIAPYTQVLSGTTVDLTICRPQEIQYTPDTALTLVVPLNNLEARVELVAPSGETTVAFRDTLSQGTHQVKLSSAQKGRHRVDIYLENVLFESLQLDFE